MLAPLLLALALIDQPTPAVSLTIYSAADPRSFDPQQFAAQQRMGADPFFAWQVPGFGIVRETRSISLKQGVNDAPFTDVAAFIDPTTVSFVDTTDPNTKVLEQNFQFDLVSATKLYERYLGQAVQLIPHEGKELVSGTLLAANQGQFVVSTNNGVRVVPQERTEVVLGPLPGGLQTKPTLVWKLDAPTGGVHTVRTTYQTAGMTWRADYNLVLAADDASADLTAWVTLMNVCGASFENAQLKLVAGDVQTVQPRPMHRGRSTLAAAPMSGAEDAGFREEELFEYHLYTLPRPTTVRTNSSQQIALFPPVADVTVAKKLVYVGGPDPSMFGGGLMVEREIGAGANTKVGVYITFTNDEKSKLGMPLPKGRVRVYKNSASSDGTLEFVGEDVIDHTPKNETVRLRLGNAFDVTGERVQTNFKVDNNRKEMSESFKITLKNAKKSAQLVEVREPLYRWTNWEITAKSAEFRKIDARTIAWDVMVPQEGSASIEYTVRYTW